VIFQQPAGETITQLAGTILSLGKRHQPVLTIAAEHLIKRMTRLLLKFPTTLLKFSAGDSRHDRSSMIKAPFAA